MSWLSSAFKRVRRKVERSLKKEERRFRKEIERCIWRWIGINLWKWVGVNMSKDSETVDVKDSSVYANNVRSWLTYNGSERILSGVSALFPEIEIFVAILGRDKANKIVEDVVEDIIDRL